MLLTLISQGIVLAYPSLPAGRDRAIRRETDAPSLVAVVLGGKLRVALLYLLRKGAGKGRRNGLPRTC